MFLFHENAILSSLYTRLYGRKKQVRTCRLSCTYL